MHMHIIIETMSMHDINIFNMLSSTLKHASLSLMYMQLHIQHASMKHAFHITSINESYALYSSCIST